MFPIISAARFIQPAAFVGSSALNRPACSWRQLGWIEKRAEARRNQQIPRRAKWRTGMASAWLTGWGDVKPCGFIECTLEPACREAVDHDASKV